MRIELTTFPPLGGMLYLLFSKLAKPSTSLLSC
jgi:hypothetical protein